MNKLTDWERIENEEIDAIIFEHEDYYNVFHILEGLKIQVIIEKPEANLTKWLSEVGIINVERIRMNKS